MARVRRIVETFEQAAATGSGALALEGQLVELPVLTWARRLLARAGEITGTVGSFA